MRRFNFTGRKKIYQKDIHVHIKHVEGKIPEFDIVLDLEDYQLPNESMVIAEAYQATRWMRFELGQVGLITKDRNHQLTDFDDIENLRFRLKVIETESGKLLALANGVHPFTEGEDISEHQMSILPVRSVDLSNDGVCWKLDYGEQDVSLLIEKELGGKEQVVRSGIFKSLILPSAMREVLNNLVNAKEWDEELNDISDWQTKWLRFTKDLGAGMPDRENPSDNTEWVDDAIRRLVTKIGGRSEFVNSFEENVW